MIKKTLVGGGVALLVSGLLFGRDAVSYVQTSAGWVKDSIRQNVPVEFQIERAKKLIDELEPEVRRNRHLIVKEEVALEQLAQQIEGMDARQVAERANLERMVNAMQTSDAYIFFAGHRYTRDQVNRDMKNRLERCRTNDETLFNLRRVHNARQQSLTAAQQELEQMLASRNQLLAEVQKLEARQKMVSVAQSSSEFNMDSSLLARVNQLVRDLDTQLDVTERMLDAEMQFSEEIPLDGPVGDDVTEQVTAYLSGGEPQVEVIAAEIKSDPQL